MNKNIITPIAAIALALGSAGAAFAAGGTGADNKGFYVGVDLGQSRNDLSSPTSPALRLDKTDTAYGIFGGYQFNKYFATELSVHKLGQQRIGDSDAKTSAYSLDAIGRLPVNDKFSVYGRLGGAHYERDFSGLDGAGNKISTGFKVGLGVDYAINKDWALRTELTRYNNLPDLGTYGRTMDSWNVGVSYRF
ncbi:OOP family OmpA-OmpF porin [Paucibacter oligotrophus]|uniref:OOP family OmpA-OmpF porin n=1 Tax=Roseateles oligotrophus TaxID=1769250 RepID=A0A840L0R1_9BURK|nr:outer membrane beta-barrel protein [Roseateles oligotrophus]MBB4841830.1 OOP family OmpA-OmpF porin [Roseateles oligotrophus]